MQNSVKWCASLKDGLKIAYPDEILAKSYLNEAKSSLKRAETDLKEGDLLWATVVIYYAEYYALYAFLQRIGVKCENHHCSILSVGELLGNEKIITINNHKSKRIDAQYYMRIGKQEEVQKILQEAKAFVAEFDNLVSNLSNEDIEKHRRKLKILMQ